MAAMAVGALACTKTAVPLVARDPLAADVYAKAIERARASASAPFAEKTDEQPRALAEMDYLQHRAIQYRPEKSVRVGDRFALQFFHRGYYHKRGVDILLQPRTGEATPFTYDSANFSGLATEFPASIGYAGFRVHVPDNSAKTQLDEDDELLVFLDASYFRLRGMGQSYGLSGRGLAVNTEAREEFPEFTTFWIVEPTDQDVLEVVALMDSPTVTGAYRFTFTPGASSRMNVEATVFPRVADAMFGFSPFSTMFALGQNAPKGGIDDFRPEVHDSDGLLWQTRGVEPQWRPLMNGRGGVHTTVYPTRELERFAFQQRERRYVQYVDVLARYEERPGMLVEPKAGFEDGALHLFEIPTTDEYMDNIVGYFVPQQTPVVGEPIRVAYTLTTLADESLHPLATVQRTRVGRVDLMRPIKPDVPGRAVYFIDWAGASLPADKAASVKVEVTATAGTIVEPKIERVGKTGEWRCFFEHRAEGDTIANLRAVVTLDGKPIAETWNYTTGDR